MRLLFKFLRLLPLSFLNVLFSFVMLVLYAVLKRRRKIAQNNIKMAIGGNYKKTALKTYLYFAKMAAFNIKYLGNKKFIEKHVTVKGLENFEYAKSLKKGVIFTTAHFGNWEMMACGFAVLVEPVNVMVRPLDNKSLDEIIENMRLSCGNKILSSRISAFSFIKLLKKRSILAVLIDQAGGDGIFRVDFFSKKAKVSESIALFSYKLGTPILPVYMKENKSSLEIVIEKPIIAQHSDNFEKDIEDTMRKVYIRFENWIKKEPNKYLWLHNRWK